MNVEEASVSRRRYRPLLELGRGGMAKVYLAESLASGIRKLVVLKVLNRELADDKEMRVAFRREAELSARMNHPNVVQVYEVVEYGGTPVMVMEYLDGVALSRIHAHATLPLRLHLYALTQVLAGLHHFHELKDFEGNELNAVHRDVSPQNVLVLHEGPVKVVDFGIAKVNSSPDHATRTGMIKGKIHYMPPEQLLGEATIDRRADIFAVGVMLWEAIAGRRMWDGVPEGKVVRSLARGEIPRIREASPEISAELEHIVERSLAIERSGRYDTAEQMQIELERALMNMEGHVHPRELTEFMQKNFGDRRQFQQRTVERALRSPATTMSGIMECVTPSSVDGEPGSALMPISDPVEDLLSEQHPRSSPVPGSTSSRSAVAVISEPQPGRSWLKAGMIGAGLSVLLIAGVVVLRKPAPSPAPTAVTAPQAPIELSVSASPPNAEILLDDVSIGTGKVVRSIAPSSETATLEVRLPGYITEKRTVRLTGNTSLEVSLREEPKAEADATPPVADAASKEDALKPRGYAGPRGRAFVPPRGAKPPAAPEPAPAAPAAAPAAPEKGANCNPPYKLSVDGVKVFKPECF